MFDCILDCVDYAFWNNYKATKTVVDMNTLVKILADDNGEVIENPKWCFSVHWSGNQALCSGQFYGYGESGAEYEIKSTKKGGITCTDCLEKIKQIKAIKL